jgi:hypothetical protein
MIYLGLLGFLIVDMDSRRQLMESQMQNEGMLLCNKKKEICAVNDEAFKTTLDTIIRWCRGCDLNTRTARD